LTKAGIVGTSATLAHPDMHPTRIDSVPGLRMNFGNYSQVMLSSGL